MRVVWVSFAPLRKTPAGLTSDIASVRYRVTLPAAAVAGGKVTQIVPGTNRRTLLERFAGAEVVVFGKLFDFALAELVLDLVAALRERKVKVVMDFSDDNFGHPAAGPVYRALANAADLLVASTEGLAEVLRAEAAVPVRVVTDPVEGRRGEPRAATRRPVQLLWFGHPLNLDTLELGLPQIKVPFELTLVTAPGSGAEALGHRWRPWSTQAVFEELRECDAVIIPSDPHNPRKIVKSPNRFTEALWAGRFVIAHPLPSYQALAAFGWIGDNLGDGLTWLLDNPQAAVERVRAGQRAVEEHFSPQAVGRAWQVAIAAA